MLPAPVQRILTPLYVVYLDESKCNSAQVACPIIVNRPDGFIHALVDDLQPDPDEDPLARDSGSSGHLDAF